MAGGVFASMESVRNSVRSGSVQGLELNWAWGPLGVVIGVMGLGAQGGGTWRNVNETRVPLFSGSGLISCCQYNWESLDIT